MAAGRWRRRLDQIERKVLPKHDEPNEQLDLSELTDEELVYLQKLVAAGQLSESDPKLMEICEKVKIITPGAETFA